MSSFNLFFLSSHFSSTQFLVYASYFTVIAVVFFLAGLYKLVSKRCSKTDGETNTKDSDSLSRDSPPISEQLQQMPDT